MEQAIISKAGEIVESKIHYAGYCALAQIDMDGCPTAATISVSKAKGIEWVIFYAGLSSNWVKRAKKCSSAGLCFNSESPLYNITLVGSIEVVTDSETKKEMWHDGLENYFSGPEDSECCVLRFRTQRYSLMLGEEGGAIRGTL